ncbi:NADP-dependent oxidoreductase [Streptomyces drozdowiczii]|uniref:NADP-dependent oxidoreductase n=1 Tax=Streptomyces drozdowiczii TaxID=202862 RepID=A0ABY6Q148_9ACTN|nr:NADP-dependent oxidoreductase [Streptomyces drozdowiczii]MCX0241720.1 NADP-dependent oxidoreductase [Streptomyces drozdowiczii]UZK58059.1 NADP-dependent oxidoreductase [Streptomyces drozdowiczii]
MRTGRLVRLVSRPAQRVPDPGDVELVEVDVRDPAHGEVLVRNLYMSIDPGALLRMSDLSALDIPHFETGEPLWSDAVGEVVESRYEGLAAGDLVWHRYGWRDYAVGDGRQFRRLDPHAYPSLSHHLSFGVVAYIGVELARIRPGDTVLVSSAAGGVGSIAGQIARLRGAGRVIGSVGSPEKVRFAVETLGYDAAFDYHDGIAPQIGGELDVYFDSVGGEHLEAAIDALRPRGRIVMCGQTEQVRSGVPTGPRNMLTVVGKRLSIQGFYTFDHPELMPKFEEEFTHWVRTGRIVVPETVVDGLENGVDAAVGQLTGRFTGKVVLRF